MKITSSERFVLGLDIGVASLGWAILRVDDRGRPGTTLRTGVHLFEAGVEGGKMDAETAMMRGKEQSKATPRREARALRRQVWRRARRKKKLLGALVRHDLLPEGDIRTPIAIDAYVKAIDARLAERWERDASHTDRQTTMYRVRAAAAERRIERHDFGRALYHLAQRRGFLSNKKADKKEDERSEMKAQIGDLAERIAAHWLPTLGAYLSSLDPMEQRLRGRWTARSMYLAEFDRMWEMQGAEHGLTEEARSEIHDAIFHQRPLKDQRHLIGRCSLTGERRAPLSLRVAQRFRVLQQVNHLRVIDDDLSERSLSAGERAALVDALCRRGDLSMAKAKSAAGIPRTSEFSIERGGEKKLVGHRVDADLRAVFGDRWDGLSEADRDAAAEDVRSIRLPEALRRRGAARWGLAPGEAEAFSALEFEEGHSAHSKDALVRLVAQMESGLSYSEARQREYPESFDAGKAHDLLPPLEDWSDDLRNPSVVRALTEVRKVVNAIVRRYGKPVRVHVELARDLKKGRSRRETEARRMREREAERERAAAAILSEIPSIGRPKRWQIERWLLAEECGWRCPFTGRSFGARELLGREPQFDVEHLWPLSRSLDDSYLNKTICHHEENRARKKGRTPHEAYGGDAARFEEILQRVRAFKGDRFALREKLRRFQEPIDEGFSARHLNETRYIGRLAADYLGLLYGGRVDTDGRKRILTPTGGLTAWQRRGWGLDAVLSGEEEKDRSDHRHHAIDAIVIALSDDGAVKRLSDAAETMEREGRSRPFGEVAEPWPCFRDEVRTAIDAVIVSHRQSRRVRGKLHDDTLYSREIGGKRRVRKALDRLTAAEIERGRVVDKRALAAIRAKLAELRSDNPSKAFAEPAHLPLVPGAGGAMVRLRRVRVAMGDRPHRFGRGERERWANSASNHHAVILERRNGAGEVVGWEDSAVSLAVVMDRAGRGRRADDGTGVVFTLAINDYIEMDCEGGRRVYRVTSVSQGDIGVREHWDGRTQKELRSIGDRERLSGKRLFERRAQKVHVNYLGEVKRAGG